MFHRFLSTHGCRIPHPAAVSAVSAAASPVGRIPRHGNRKLHVWPGPQIILSIKYLKNTGLKGRPVSLLSPVCRDLISPSAASNPPAPRKPAGSTLRLYLECRRPCHHVHHSHPGQAPLSPPRAWTSSLPFTRVPATTSQHGRPPSCSRHFETPQGEPIFLGMKPRVLPRSAGRSVAWPARAVQVQPSSVQGEEGRASERTAELCPAQRASNDAGRSQGHGVSQEPREGLTQRQTLPRLFSSVFLKIPD